MSVNLISLGKRVRERRCSKGISQEILSEEVRISPTYISYIENGIKCMSLNTFVSMANALDTSSDLLLFDSLTYATHFYPDELSQLFEDCSEFEKHILIDVLKSTKESMRNNKYLFR